jgi:hypothetical protein
MAGVSQPPKVRSAVLVANRMSPADIHTKPDGTVVRTLWGELAWQLRMKLGFMTRTDTGRLTSGFRLMLPESVGSTRRGVG